MKPETQILALTDENLAREIVFLDQTLSRHSLAKAD
jgi:hypothetical protein